MIVCTETVFTLHTTHTSYQLAVAPNGMVLHTYYGTRLPEDVPSLADARMPHSDPGCWPDLLPQELSGGMQRRVAIARAFAYGEQCGQDTVYLLDEPLKGLDEETAIYTLRLIRRWVAGRLAFFITHDR